MFTFMTDRSELIKGIAQIGANYSDYKKEIQEYPWDCDSELYFLTKQDLLSVFSRFESGELDSDAIENWANFLECRDDLGYESDYEDELRDMIFLLANPVINYSIDVKLINELAEKIRAL
ncbi:hypothetical protein [Thalassotalea sediminis]|uniref:hypothetical protein n=1 Tax=Thalassotalea sediminis TaxID=1759089 RepID=UPI00257221EF|nr:hypothetical protein [Thalassotalea sediminis]